MRMTQQKTSEEFLKTKISTMLASHRGPAAPLEEEPYVAHLRPVLVDENYEAWVDEAQHQFFLQVGVGYLDQPLWFGPLPL